MLYYLQDERIQNVLGHLRKKFEGEITHMNLGKSSKIANLFALWSY
jgi:hypothetical protein